MIDQVLNLYEHLYLLLGQRYQDYPLRNPTKLMGIKLEKD